MDQTKDEPSILTIRLVATADGYPISGLASIDPQPVSTRGRHVGLGLCLLLIVIVGFFAVTSGKAQHWLSADRDGRGVLSALTACSGYEVETGRIAGQYRNLKAAP